MADAVSQMTTNPSDGGFYNYGPQSQLPPSVSVVVNNPPQSLPQVQSSAYDPYAVPTAHRPSTDANIGENLHPALENALAIAPMARSRYAPSVVYPSSVPSYERSANGVLNTEPVLNRFNLDTSTIPHDPTEAGSR